jgi:hypothetical protein
MTAIECLYRRTELLIGRIANCWEQFSRWVVLGQIPDFDEALKSTLTEQANLNAITHHEAELELEQSPCAPLRRRTRSPDHDTSLLAIQNLETRK